VSIGKVILVGAGPGDEGLLTIKGKRWIERADVVIYDHLANSQLVRFAKSEAELIYVGKKSGSFVLSQDQINKLLIEKAQEGKTVVRLKGGDPFIFGRGGEEVQELSNAKIPFSIVPGVTSPVGVSAYAGIPLTHRDCASTISIVTGSVGNSPDSLPIDWEELAKWPGTLVFLMGARKLKSIAENLIRYGKKPETPIAVIQWGTLPKQKTWTSVLGGIVKTIDKQTIKPPALTIVGDVVALKNTLDWYETLPLFGKNVVITRPEEQSEGFRELLLEQGANPIPIPVIKTFPPESWDLLDIAINRLDSYYGLIFTSVNGVRYFIERLHFLDKDIRELKGVRLYAIGPKTAKAVKDLGIKVDVVPENYVAESLLESIGKEPLDGKRFLLPRATVARETLPDELRNKGAEIDVAPAYQTLPPQEVDSEILEKIKAGEIDVITFTASSTVDNFVSLVGHNSLSALKDVVIACIGPITAKTAEKHGLTPTVIPEKYTVESLVLALENYYSSK
jgi:uroporphyrinogen III methyltransferase / synthase